MIDRNASTTDEFDSKRRERRSPGKGAQAAVKSLGSHHNTLTHFCRRA
jgi:hypothetical protein